MEVLLLKFSPLNQTEPVCSAPLLSKVQAKDWDDQISLALLNRQPEKEKVALLCSRLLTVIHCEGSLALAK